jgi:predicted PilT family ATPase
LAACFLVLIDISLKTRKDSSHARSKFLQQIIQKAEAAEKGKKGKEIIKVKKKLDKDFKMKEIDFGELGEEMVRVRNMMDKNKCSDVFYDLEKTIAKKDVKKYLRYKYMVNNALCQYHKLKVLVSMGCIKGELYLLALLEIIRLSKIIFVQQIE